MSFKTTCKNTLALFCLAAMIAFSNSGCSKKNTKNSNSPKQNKVTLSKDKIYVGKEYEAKIKVAGKIFVASRKKYNTHTPDGLIALDKLDVLVRISDVKEYAPGEFEYTIAYIPNKAGTFDLKDSLLELKKYPDAVVPSHKFTAHFILSDKEKLDTNLSSSYNLNEPNFGNYWLYAKLFAAFWFTGLIFIILYKRKFKTKVKLVKRNIQSQSLADQLKRFIKIALDNKATVSDKAKLDVLIVHYWRKQLNIENKTMQESLDIIKKDPKAGELILQVEKWLHSPTKASEEEISNLLAPYKNAPAVSDLQLQGETE